MKQAMNFFDPPPLRYLGSKWKLADWIIAQMPPHVTYVEPFAGSATVFFRKSPSAIEVLNDLNGDVVNFFDILRSQTDELVRAIDLTPVSRREYLRSFEACTDPLERARRFYIRSWQGFRGGGTHDPAGWRFRVDDVERSATREWSRLDGLILGAHRLKDAQLECDTALAVIERCDTPQTLFYVDPPYVIKARSRKDKRYVHEMTDSEHRQLAEVLHHVQGMVLLSGYKSELYLELYADWHFSTKSATTNGNSVALEYLWCSPNATDLSQLPLFEVR